MPNVKSPSVHQHQVMQNAYHYFNRTLFDGKLTTCMISFSRRAKSNAWYCPAVWHNAKRSAAEISINPDQMIRPLIETFSSLVHEMVHHWQYMKGTAPRRGYHDREWAEKMRQVGLHPVSTDGEEKEVGQQMTHVIVPGGPFELAFVAQGASLHLPYLPVSLEKKAKEKKAKENKVKYTCKTCNCNVWGKPGLLIGCLSCEDTDCEPMFSEGEGKE
jgi:hypothetical protein